MVRHFPESVLDQAWKQIPPAWTYGDQTDLEALLDQLWKRRNRVEALIDDVRRNRPSFFPKWT
jgi:hypothetical protein